MKKYCCFMVSLILITVFPSGCIANQPVGYLDRNLVNQVDLWLNDNALPNDSIALHRTSNDLVGTYPVISLPYESETFDILGIIAREKPEYVLALNNIIWDGVTYQTWFQERYKLLYTFSGTGEPNAGTKIFGYQPSPYDIGKSNKVTQVYKGGAPVLAAYKINTKRIFPDDILYLTLDWQLSSYQYQDDIKIRIELVSDKENITTYGDQNFTPQFETLFDTTSLKTYHSLIIPGNLPVGTYSIHIYLSQPNGEPFYAMTASGEDTAYVQLTTLEHPKLVDNVDQSSAFPVSATILEQDNRVIELTGYDLITHTAMDSRIRVGFVWRVVETPAGDYNVFVHIRDKHNNVIAQTDSKPLNWTFPTTDWQVGQYIYDAYEVSVSEGVDKGFYSVYTGLYEVQSGRRLEIVNQSGIRYEDDEIYLADFRIR